MKRNQIAKSQLLEITRLCHSALDAQTLRTRLLQRLRMIIPFDYAYFSITDPATQLSTHSVLAEEPPAWCMDVFLQNEYLQDDFNKFTSMFRNHQPVAVLSEATGYELARSHRYREMLAPMDMEDELRAIFVTDAACWGTLCLHVGPTNFGYGPEQAAFLAHLAPHIADGLRKALLLEHAPLSYTPDGPGVLILAEDLSIIAMTAVAEYWMRELTEGKLGNQLALPVAVRSVVASLQAIEQGRMAPAFTPKIRLRTRSGNWLMLHAARLQSSDQPGRITVIFELAQPAELAPLIMQAYDLTRREGEVTRSVLLGLSTAEIAAELHISVHTVQHHLKAIFAKVGVRSRGELTMRVFIGQSSHITTSKRSVSQPIYA